MKQCFQPGKDGNQQLLTKLRVAAGLADMVCAKFKNAAKLFLQANIDHVDFPEVGILLFLGMMFCPLSDIPLSLLG